MKKYILITLLLLASCSTMIKSTSDINNIININKEVNSGNVMNTIKSVELTDTDMQIITHGINYFNSFAYKWKDIYSLDSKDNSFKDFLNDYYELKKRYIEIQYIIVKNWEIYTEDNKLVLLEYQNKANKADNLVQSLINNADRLEMIKESLVFANIILGVMK